ncbi:heparan-alpha-glucosaminide N-acetyltransferase domain-containing protein [Bacillus cereus]|nr:heparan-alpha-glucosaminide N-acetyltransferase domain-containing protein [Bacillus cereus]
MNTKKRIIGLDFARAWAMFGMLLVNFMVITGAEGNGPPFLITFMSLFEGRASALFVILAGIGITLMTRSAVASNEKIKISNSRKIIWKRSLFLFILGLLLYIMEWTGDILHYYGVYLFVAAFLITVRKKLLLFLSIIILLIAQYLQLTFNPFEGWEGPTPFINYVDFWTIQGFLRNLFFNGYHPIFPWFSFFLIGMIIGRLDLHNKKIRKGLLLLGITTTILTEILSKGLTYFFIPYIGKEVATFLFNTGPILPNVLYILSATGSAIATLIICLYIAEKYEMNWFVTSIIQTGQLTLTHYVSHVFIGIGTLILLNRMEHQSLLFVLLFAIAFFSFSILISVLWRKKFSRGPIEWIMRKLAG